MTYKLTLPIPRQRDTQSIFINAHGNVVSSILPGMDTPSENAFFRYCESVCVPRFRVEVSRLTTVDVYPTTCTFFFPHGEEFERVDITCRAISVPVFFDVPKGMEPKHACISDAGYLWVLFDDLTTDEIIFFQSEVDAGQEDNICSKALRICLGFVRHAHELTRPHRILSVTAKL